MSQIIHLTAEPMQVAKGIQASAEPAVAPCRLEAVALECIRGERRLFADLAFVLEAGQVLQIEGPNGCGKTTLLRLLCGLAVPESGAVYWGGEDIRRIRAEYSAELAYVGHMHAVTGGLTPIENLQMTAALERTRADVDLEEVLDRVGLWGYEDVPCRTLSAGQRRRVALARLLVTRVRLWILDEPFTALDPGGRRQIEQIVSAHVAQGGLAVLTTHHTVELDEGQVKILQLGG